MSIPEQGTRLIKLIRSVDKCKHSIIAGGYVRDALLDAPFKDIDVFIPCKNLSRFKMAAEELRDSTDIFDEISEWQENGYRELSPKFLGLYNAKFEGESVQFIGYQMEEDDFATELIGDFHFYIDKVAYDGEELTVSHRHEEDVRHRTLTLCKLNSVMDLPGSMRKYERLHAKFPNYRFNTTIELKEGAPKMPKSLGSWTGGIPYIQPILTAASSSQGTASSIAPPMPITSWMEDDTLTMFDNTDGDSW